MIKGIKSFELLPVESRVFLQDLDLDVIEVKRLTNDKKSLFLIETSKGQFVLKVNLPPSNFARKLRGKIIDSLRFKQECQFYKNTNKTECNGNYPKYVGSDKNNLLIEYIPKNDFEIKNLKPAHWYLVGQELVKKEITRKPEITGNYEILMYTNFLSSVFMSLLIKSVNTFIWESVIDKTIKEI